MAHFEIRDLTFTYPTTGKKALDNVSLKIEKGSYVTICGKSGSGKTTLLRHLKPVLTPSGSGAGEILFEGMSLSETDLRTQAGQIGFVMQNPDNQIVTDKVWHELAFGLESMGYDNKTMRMRVAEMANYFGIQSWFHKNVMELSGGEKQLLNLASIMAMQPSVLVLDEPTSQLDPIAAADFLNTVRKINMEIGTTIVISEHRLENVFYCSDKVVVMDEGKIIADDASRHVGDLLKGKNDDMFAALPSPMQIYYAFGGKEDKSGGCPLTVRDGRNWLSGCFADRGIKTNELDKTQKNLGEDYALTLKDIWFRYEKELPDVLRGVNINIPRQCLFAVMGGNGTGKTTMLKSICGICRYYRGKVIINGKRLDKYKSGELFTGNLAMLPQDPQSLFVKKTVREDLAEMLQARIPDDEKRKLIEDVSKTTQIVKLLESHPYDLSGGEQQRAALAKVLLTQPKILLLDEPTKGIDAFFKIQLAAIIKKLIANGVTVVMVSHDVEFCAKYADIAAMFFDGSIITTNTPDKFFASNSFYTTAANRMSRHLFRDAITNEDVIELCKVNM